MDSARHCCLHCIREQRQMHSLCMQRDMPELVYKQGMLLLNFLSQCSINAICSIHIKTCNNFRKQCQQKLVSVGEVHETWKRSKGNGLNEVTSYRTIHVDRLRRLELQSMGLQVQCCNHLLFLSWLS